MGFTIDLLKLARSQGGCVTRSQLTHSGVSPRTIDRMVADGRIDHAFSDLYRLIPSAGWIDDLKAAMAALPGAIASFHSAAFLLELPRVRPLAVATVHTRTTHRFPGVQIRRAHDLAPAHVTEASGIRCTTVPRTVFDLAAVLHWRHVEAIIQDLVIARRLDLADLDRLVVELARRGKPGLASMRRILERLGEGAHPMTELERRGWRVLIGAGIVEGQREFSIPWEQHRRFDVAWPKARLAIEWDSRRWHGAFEQMDFDRRRDRSAALHGWTILRYTWDDVTLRSRLIVHETRRLLRQGLAGP